MWGTPSTCRQPRDGEPLGPSFADFHTGRTGNYAPSGWAMCNGQSLTIAQYQAPFALIGVTYGDDGVRNFALLNLNGCAVVGGGQLQGGGAERVTLTTNQLPAHSHALNANSS